MKGRESLKQNIEEIYKQHSKTVYKYLYCLCQDEQLAEELTQETFYLAMKSIDTFRGDCKIQVWLCQIGKNEWFKELKRRKKARVVSMDAEIGEIKSDIDVEDEFIESDTKEELYRHLEKLDEQTRNLILLKLTTGLTFKEIAEILGKSENWARVTYYRGKEKLIKMMRKEEQ